MALSAAAVPSFAQRCGTCNTRTHFKFRLIKKTGINVDSNYVKTTAIYVNTFMDDGNVMKYSFLRFFPNGKVYISCLYRSFPTNDELNDLTYGDYGEYRLDSTRLTIETHSASAGYYYQYYEVRRNEVLLSQTQLRKSFPFKAKLERAPEVSYKLFHRPLVAVVPGW